MPNRKSVIVVDDDPNMLRGVNRLLRHHGFKAAVFDSVESFRDRADLDNAFCIVLDINLNDGSGIELRRRLSERPALPDSGCSGQRPAVPGWAQSFASSCQKPPAKSPKLTKVSSTG